MSHVKGVERRFDLLLSYAMKRKGLSVVLAEGLDEGAREAEGGQGR